LRRQHFDALQPVCPRCALEGRAASPLELASVLAGDDEFIREGLLNCPARECRLEYPIIDGVPIIVPDIRAFVTANVAHIHRRSDLSGEIEGLIADAVGPGSELDQAHQHLSIYCWGHYADMDPDEAPDEGAGNIVSCLEQGLELPIEATAPALDLGCAVGRTTFELARRVEGPVLGVDLNFGMLQAAQRVLQTGRLSYRRRRVGLVGDRREFDLRLPAREHVDFWACDTLALPFTPGRFGFVLAMNLLDCVASPRDLLAVVRGMLRDGGSALLSTPYDWSPNATPVESWIGGHSQRGPDRGAAEPFLRALLSAGAHRHSVDGLEIIDEIDRVPWVTRLHDRSKVSYSMHVVAVRAV